MKGLEQIGACNRERLPPLTAHGLHVRCKKFMETQKEKFLRSFVAAYGYLTPQATSDHAHLVSDGKYEDVLARADLWLSPRYFDDYRSADFAHLGEESQARLDSLVQQFTTLASTVPNDAPATQNQHDEGKAFLEEMHELLHDDLEGINESSNKAR